MELSRWQQTSRHDQLLHIGAEIMRAANYQDKDTEKFMFLPVPQGF